MTDRQSSERPWMVRSNLRHHLMSVGPQNLPRILPAQLQHRKPGFGEQPAQIARTADMLRGPMPEPAHTPDRPATLELEAEPVGCRKVVVKPAALFADLIPQPVRAIPFDQAIGRRTCEDADLCPCPRAPARHNKSEMHMVTAPSLRSARPRQSLSTSRKSRSYRQTGCGSCALTWSRCAYSSGHPLHCRRGSQYSGTGAPCKHQSMGRVPS